MTTTSINLREIAARRREAAVRLEREAEAEREDAARLEQIADALDEGPEWCTLPEVADALGSSYEAARKRVDRAGVGRTIANRVYAPRKWLDEQVDTRPKSV